MLDACGSIYVDGAAVDGWSVKRFDNGISLELRQPGNSKGLGGALEDGSPFFFFSMLEYSYVNQ